MPFTPEQLSDFFRTSILYRPHNEMGHQPGNFGHIKYQIRSSNTDVAVSVNPSPHRRDHAVKMTVLSGKHDHRGYGKPRDALLNKFQIR